MGVAVLILLPLPWLDRSPVKSIRYKGAHYKTWLALFVVSFLVLGYLGTVPTNHWGQFGPWLGGAERATVVARILTVVYFLFFLLMPWYSRLDRTRPEPARLTA
jgi:ubiquinol-cytochrome c reductase cytochrome b subunit